MGIQPTNLQITLFLCGCIMRNPGHLDPFLIMGQAQTNQKLRMPHVRQLDAEFQALRNGVNFAPADSCTT